MNELLPGKKKEREKLKKKISVIRSVTHREQICGCQQGRGQRREGLEVWG